MSDHIIRLGIDKLAKEVGYSDPTYLVTRPMGEKFLPEVVRILTDIPETSVLLLDFSSVRVMDSSFSDELFGHLAARRARRSFTGGCLVLEKLNESSLEDLGMALLSRPFRDPGTRNCVIPVLTHKDTISLIGKFESHVQETFELVQKYKRLTAREIADGLNLDIAAASTRLKVLYNLGLATRTDTKDAYGKQYVYESLI